MRFGTATKHSTNGAMGLFVYPVVTDRRNGASLVRKLEDAIDGQGQHDGKITARELQLVLSKPWRAAGTQMEPPSDSNISPSGDYVVIGRIGSGPGQAESDSSREYCSAIEIRTGCITADQTGEICGAGWQAGQRAQWGTDDQTNLMLKSDRPSASRLLHLIGAGQPPRALVDGDSGADNLLRCDPPSSANREIYRKIAGSLHETGTQSDAALIDVALSNAAGATLDARVPTPMETGHRAIVSAPKASLYTAPDDAHASQAYLVQNDAVTILKQSPAGWAYVDYVNSSGKHLLRWIKIDQLGIKP